MPKTTAELTEIVARMGESLKIALVQIAELEQADTKRAEELRGAREDGIRARQELVETRRQLDEERAAGRTRDEKIVELLKEQSAERSRRDEHAKQIEQVTARVWGLLALLLVAALSFIGYSLRK